MKIVVLTLCLAQETKAERETAWVVETTVKGKLTSEYSGDYPFEYEGWTTLSSAEIDALRKDGKVADDLAKRLAGAFAEPHPVEKREGKEQKEPGDPRIVDPKTSDGIVDCEFTVKEGALTGKFTLRRKEGPGTRKIVAEVSGTLGKEKLTMKLSKANVTGTWDWGGGVADLEGALDTLDAASRLPKK